MRIKGSAQQLEARRRRAAALLRRGLGVNEAARRVGASSSSGSRWNTTLKRSGEAGLKARPHPGRRSRLSPARKRQLVTMLKRGPLAAGYPTDLWTCRRVADLIGRRWGVWYHPDHVWKILRSLGFSSQKPDRRARERDEQAVARWRTQRWPRLKKTRGG